MALPLINAGARVLAAVDASAYATSVASHASWAAVRLNAPLAFLHAIDRSTAPVGVDLSGNLSLGSQEELLSRLAAMDEQRGRLAQEHGRLLLEKLRAQVAASHVAVVEIRQRHGALVDTLLELESDIRLFVLGKRGEDASLAKDHLGSNLERVVRAVHRPVLIASQVFRPISRFLVAFDGSATARKCVEMVCASPLLRGLACDLLVVGDAGAAIDQHLEWAGTQLRAAGFTPDCHVVAGSPDAVIAHQATERSIDLLVMGAYGHSRIRSLIVGSTTTQVLRTVEIPVLLLR